jgi:hypothetical protein
MAGLNETELVTSIGSNLIDKLASLPGFGSIISILQAVGIVIFIYLIILIVRAFVQTRQALRIKDISKNVEAINKKMDILVNSKKKK